MPRHKFSYLLAAFFVMCLSVATAQETDDDNPPPAWLLRKLGVDIDLRSGSRVFADELADTGGIILPDEDSSSSSSLTTVPQVQLRRGNVQVIDPALDTIQIFPNFRPFLPFTESETSVAAVCRTILATYTSSAAPHLIPSPSAPLALA